MYLLNAAASVRLCVETEVYFQDFEKENAAASVRLCVETATAKSAVREIAKQPPSRGCVLKPAQLLKYSAYLVAAAFAWLCVETILHVYLYSGFFAAAFARLCVETAKARNVTQYLKKN